MQWFICNKLCMYVHTNEYYQKTPNWKFNFKNKVLKSHWIVSLVTFQNQLICLLNFFMYTDCECFVIIKRERKK